MMYKNISKSLTIFLSVVILTAVLSGCGSNKAADETAAVSSSSASTGSKEVEKAATEPVTIRWVRAANEQDPAKDRILIELQKKTNTKLDIVTFPWDQFPNKQNIMMASGEQIDILNCDAGKTLNEWVKNGLVLAYDDYLKDGKYPYVSSVINADVYKLLKVNGKAYYKPIGLCPQQWAYIIRQDWLDNLGMKVPTNIDELYQVIKAFKENDPDKNGKNDTYGWFAMENGKVDPADVFQFINRAFAVNAGSGKWVEKADGTVTRWEVSDGAKEATRFVNKIVNEGLINKDWLSLKFDSAQGPESDAFAQGKYGIALTSIPNVFVDKLKKINPNAKVSAFAPINGVNGVPANGGHTGGYWWGNVIPSTSKNPEKAIELMDYTLSQEGRELTEFGIKGVHFTEFKEENGGRVYYINKAECDKDWDTKKNGYLYPLTWGAMNYHEYAYIPIKEHNFNYDEAFKDVRSWLPDDMATGQFADWQANNAKYAIASPLTNVVDDSVLGDANKLLSIFAEGYLKAVVGNSNDFDKAWGEMVDKWLKAGGDQVIKNGNDFYKASK
ncbi:extracellular solute-binding protein [Ruminiclostridium cellobioparum]|uniref:extracellular solute-binding protein n=1 Tax=Ruminiclostridium cellobioparum TaxID=29355 RepID=UPI0028A9FB50|nr:extracellular solute-binding protein [Ruminiclostridium cellobioparum]